ncbi:Uncharacterized protein PECH_004399 [Penicillium ucsense]|uniref:Major facilitator superfamily (MFS) profile domain-containing protein n=1 Tax=Penicillium ucsense TaxID=2839758 RepID=A0A8J8WJI2_9EURO|nr:Uncharacterized protein PECM_005353 [Penicillium ucsense]KAF7737083.1 Uncharacterized protein PECH_004399 [Penicillium ucsense]
MADVSIPLAPAMEAFETSNGSNITSEQDLPPVDRGKAAWLFLAACFMIEALIWGFTFSFGIFQDYYSAHEPFKSSGNIAVVGTCAMGISYMLLPVAFILLHAVPRLKLWAAPIGFVIMCLALSLSSFATSTSHLIVSQGVAYGIGASLAYAPTIVFMDDWFVQRKGLAFGIMWAGTGISGIILPIVLQWMLNAFGPQTTLRAWSVTLMLLGGPLLYFVRPRLPISRSSRTRPFDFKFLRDSTFLVYQTGNILEAVGYFLPTIYLPSFARSLGAGGIESSLTVILFNLASVFGCIAMGSLVDRCHATTCILASTVGSTIAVFCIWGFADSLGPLYVFCIMYGLFAGSFSSTWPAIVSEIKKKSTFADASIVFGFLSTGRGIGNIISGPLSEALLKGSPWQGLAAKAYGSGFGPLIVFTGVSALLGGLGVATRSSRLSQAH